jgi:hypothetical protein
LRSVHPVWSFDEVLTFFEPRAGQDVAETDLLRHFFPGEDVFGTGVDLELFEKHFLLYRRLWLFDDELRLTTGRRLWIRSIRSTLLAAPPAGLCGTLDTDVGTYCLAPLPCSVHRGLHPELATMKGYYLDWSNLNGMSQERLTSLVDGFFRWVGEGPGRANALTLFDLGDTATDAEIRQRWKALSKKNHPDRGGDVQAFQQLSAAWEVLKQRPS